MTINALLYGGIPVKGMVASVCVMYDGPQLVLMGSTLKPGGVWERAGCTITMNPAEAVDVAIEILKAVDKHSDMTRRQVDCAMRRLEKSRRKAASSPGKLRRDVRSRVPEIDVQE